MSLEPKPSVAARILPEWKAQIDRICQETGQSQSEIVQEAIGQYLKRTDMDAVQSLTQRVEVLEKQYKKLVKLL